MWKSKERSSRMISEVWERPKGFWCEIEDLTGAWVFFVLQVSFRKSSFEPSLQVFNVRNACCISPSSGPVQTLPWAVPRAGLLSVTPAFPKTCRISSRSKCADRGSARQQAVLSISTSAILCRLSCWCYDDHGQMAPQEDETPRWGYWLLAPRGTILFPQGQRRSVRQVVCTRRATITDQANADSALGLISDVQRNLILQHANSAVFQYNYLSRYITQDTQAIYCGLAP
jgi:hypothetical protein